MIVYMYMYQRNESIYECIYVHVSKYIWVYRYCTLLWLCEWVMIVYMYTYQRNESIYDCIDEWVCTYTWMDVQMGIDI